VGGDGDAGLQHAAIADDPRVIVLGEDVGIDGGVFRAQDLARRRPKWPTAVVHTMVFPLSRVFAS
jgi:pyruvate/2-oxoglutarate/acetoin dehydrogenase E1 component